MTAVLRGPADPDHYRLRVGNFRERWYTDPLPTCPIADASDWQAPSWSTIKAAAGKDWSYTSIKRVALTAQPELERIIALPRDERVSALNALNKRGLDIAKGRGSIEHWWAEDLLAGRTPREVTDPMLFAEKLPKAALVEAYEYLPALHAFFDHYQPEPVATEYVAIHRTLNGVGYGCTPDVAARIQWAQIQGHIYGIDWKTRGADSDHAAYPEEAAQIAAGARAEYIIITGPDGAPCRAPVPHIDQGLVVSIKPDGCRIYPTDIDLGFQHVEAMHAFWVARQTEKAAIGKPWPPTPIAQPVLPLDTYRVAERGPEVFVPASCTDLAYTSKILADQMLTWSPELRQYLKDWWPTDCPTPGAIRRGEAVWTEQQLDAIQQLCDLGDAPFWQPAKAVTQR